MWFVYILQHSVTKNMYIGFTHNLAQRVESHNLGKNRSTKGQEGEWVLLYYEAYLNKKDASRREYRLKHHGSAKRNLFSRITKS